MHTYSTNHYVTMMYFKIKKNKVCIETDIITCSICLDTITSNKYTTKCGHCFHKTCMRQTIQKCPCCRANIKTKSRSVRRAINSAKNWVSNQLEYLTNHHLLLAVTVCVPVMYLGVILCCLLEIGEYVCRAKEYIVPDLSVD